MISFREQKIERENKGGGENEYLNKFWREKSDLEQLLRQQPQVGFFLYVFFSYYSFSCLQRKKKPYPPFLPVNEDITITVRHSPSLPTRKIPPPFFLFFIVLKKTNERGKKEERKKKSFNDRLAVGYPPPTVYNNSTSVCGPFQSHLSSGFYLEHHRAQLEVEMFHRVAIPQEADALHVEPVERYTKKKGKHQKKKHENSINNVTWRHLGSGTRKSQTNQLIHEDQKFNGPATLIQLIIYTQPTIVYTHNA